MSIGLYKSGDWIAYYSSFYQKIVIQQICWVRKEGYYHLRSDDYVQDEDIIALVTNPVMDENSPYPSCIGGTKIPNTVHIDEKIANFEKEISIIKEWLSV